MRQATMIFFDDLPVPTARRLRLLLIAAMALTGGIATIYVFLATPTADDYCRAAYSTAPGAWLAEVIETYNVWSGRWIAHTIYALAFPRLGVTTHAYNALVFLSPFLWFVVFYCFCHILFREALPRGEKAFFAALLVCIYWTGMPGPGETWYWLTGSTEYQLPFLLMALSLVVLTSRWATEPTRVRVLAFFLGTLLGVLVAGLNEFIALFLLGALGIAAALAALRGRPGLMTLYAGAIVAIAAATAFNLAAPGSAVRAAEDFPHRHDIKFAVGTTLFDPQVSPGRWLADARLAVLTLLLLTSPWFARRAPAWLAWSLPGPRPLARWPVVAPVTALAAVYIGIFAVSYAQGSWLPPRLLNVVYGVFIVGWLATVATLAPLAQANAAAPNALTRGLRLAAAVALPVTLIASPNMLDAVRGLPRSLTEWRPQIAARDQAIRAGVQAGSIDLTLAPIRAQPMMFFWRDLAADRTDWRNRCAASFYGARSLAVRP